MKLQILGALLSLPHLSELLPSNETHMSYIRTTLKGRKKLSHIEENDPPRDDPKFEAWDDEDSLIMTWLWNSMTLEISRNYMFYSSVRSAMVIGKGPTKRSTSEGKPFTKSSSREYYTYCKRSGHTKDTYYKRYGKEKELTTGRTIEVAEKQDGLYYLQHTKICNNTNKE
ncbi:hypothetical protein CR513_60450, partial [Mucuna pruriens]